MSSKSSKIAHCLDPFRGRGLDAHYLAYFDCFNRGRYYEAHEVLEELWLTQRRGPEGDFYKGLIQLAGAFVHLQKNRQQPAAALFKLARANLEKYPTAYERLDVAEVNRIISRWLRELEAGGQAHHPLRAEDQPHLELLSEDR